MATGTPPTVRRTIKRITRRSPHLQKFVKSGYDRYLSLYIWYLEKRHCIDGPHVGVRDTQLISVTPSRIQKANDPGFFFNIDPQCKVLSGNWDHNLPSFEETFPFDAFEDHFVDEKPWSETTMYDFLEEMFAAGRSWGGYTSFPEAEERLEKIDELYNNIRQHGYLTQEEIAQNAEEHPIGIPHWANGNPIKHEIVVDIGRNGEIIFEDGRHRLAIAKILNLEEIPVQVAVRHNKWQSKREKYVSDPSSIKMSEHPDLEILQVNSKHSSE
ncbi:hypothetical protein AB7C87_18705 [Natrarchaeobius sp. A-rgal3]|uniref:hypothetical protein n=1 Tax=Natrarchaeobius versutus TaxID=1679078 RepID=UPI00350F68D9